MHESKFKCWCNERNIRGLAIRTSKRVTAVRIKKEVREFVYLITKIRVGFGN